MIENTIDHYPDESFRMDCYGELSGKQYWDPMALELHRACSEHRGISKVVLSELKAKFLDQPLKE